MSFSAGYCKLIIRTLQKAFHRLNDISVIRIGKFQGNGMIQKLYDRWTSPGAMEKWMDLFPARWRRGIAVVPVVRLSGVIGAVTPLRPGMSLAGVARTLGRAFAAKNAQAVAL